MRFRVFGCFHAVMFVYDFNFRGYQCVSVIIIIEFFKVYENVFLYNFYKFVFYFAGNFVSVLIVIMGLSSESFFV